MLSFLNKQLSSEERADELDDGNNVGSPLSGYLWKMKRKQTIIPRWDKRWFSIEGKFLRWYSASPPRKISGEIDLSVVDGINSFQTAVGAFSFMVTFPQIHAEKNVLVLRAVSYPEMRRWLNILRMQADLARGGMGMGMIYGPSYTEDQFTGKGKSVKRKKKCGEASLEAELDITLSKLDKLELELKKEKKRADIAAAASNGQIVGSVPPPTESCRRNAATGKSSGRSGAELEKNYLSEYRGYHNSPHKNNVPPRPSPANIADLDLVPRFPSKYAPRGGGTLPRSNTAELNPASRTTTTTASPQVSPMKSDMQGAGKEDGKRRDSEFVIEDMESDDAGWSPTFAQDGNKSRGNGPSSTGFSDSKHDPDELARRNNKSSRNYNNNNSGAKPDSKSPSGSGASTRRRRRDLDYPSDEDDSEDSGTEYEDGPDLHVSVISRAQRRHLKHSYSNGAQASDTTSMAVDVSPERSVSKRSFDSGIHVTEVSVAIENTPNSYRTKQERKELTLDESSKNQNVEKESAVRASVPVSIIPNSNDSVPPKATPNLTPMFHRHRKFKVVNGPNDKTPTADISSRLAAAPSTPSTPFIPTVPVPPSLRRSSLQEETGKMDALAGAKGQRRHSNTSAVDVMLTGASITTVPDVTPVFVRRPSISETGRRREELVEESSSDEDIDRFDCIIPGEKKESFSSAARRRE